MAYCVCCKGVELSTLDSKKDGKIDIICCSKCCQILIANKIPKISWDGQFDFDPKNEACGEEVKIKKRRR